MSLIQKAIARVLESRESLANPSRWLVMAFGGGQQTASGIMVNEAVALRSTTVMACVRIIAETMAQLPLPVYRRLPSGGKERAPEHPLYRVLHDQTNSEMTAFEFREVMTAHLLTWGNAYSEIERDKAGRIIALWPMLPDRTWPQRMADGRVWFATRIKRDPMSIGIDDSKTIWLPEDRVLHVKGLGFDGLKGYSPIAYARELIAQDLALNEFAGRFFGNGAVPGGVLMTPNKLSKEAHDRMKASWQEQHQGLSNAQRVAILEEGLQWKEIGVPLKDAQWIEARKYTRNEITSLYRIPPHMVGDVERSTSWGTGIEQQAIGFEVYTILPWTVRWEQAVWVKCLSEAEKRTYFAEFLVDGLVRGDLSTRTSAYQAGIQNGWLSPNEIREAENRNPYEGGDKHYVPLNFTTVESGIAGTAPALRPGAQKALVAPDDAQPSAAAAPSVGIEIRRAFAQAQRHVFLEVYERAQRREKADIARAMERRTDPEKAAAWVRQFYADHRDYVAKALLPVLMSFAEGERLLVGQEAGREIAAGAEFWRFVKDYAESAAERYCVAALRSIAQVPMKQVAESIERRDLELVVNAELAQCANALTLAVYREAGRKTKRWMLGDDCAECRAQVATIAIGERFPGKVLHPPLHEGCTCLIGDEPVMPVSTQKRLALTMAQIAQQRANGEVRPVIVNVSGAQDSRTVAIEEDDEMRAEERALFAQMAGAIAMMADRLSQPTPAPQVVIAEGAVKVNVAPPNLTIADGAVRVESHAPEPTDLEVIGPGGRMTVKRRRSA